MFLYVSYQKFAQSVHVSYDIYHLLAATFMCICSLELSAMVYGERSWLKCVTLWLMRGKCHSSIRSFCLEWAETILILFKETKDYKIMGDWPSLFEFFKASALARFIALLEKGVKFTCCWASSVSSAEPTSPSSLHPIIPRSSQCLQWVGSHHLISLTWQCSHSALLTGFPNSKLATNVFSASNMSLKTHSPEPLEWSQICLLQVGSMNSIQVSLGGLFRKKRRVTGLTLELLNLSLNFNKFSEWSVYILKFKKLYSMTPPKGISFLNISFESSWINLFSSNTELVYNSPPLESSSLHVSMVLLSGKLVLLNN